MSIGQFIRLGEVLVAKMLDCSIVVNEIEF